MTEPKAPHLGIGGLPDNPTPEQLRYFFTFGPLLRERQSSPQRGMAHISSYIGLSQILGHPLPASALREQIQKIGWRPLLLRLAALAAVLGNDPAGHQADFVRRAIADPILARGKRVDDWQWGLIADYVAQNPTRAAIHEQLIYFLEAMCILEGAEEDREPSDLEVAFLCLAANDHLSGWFEPDAHAVSDLERVVAEMCHISRYNHHPDPLRSLARASVIFSRKPPHGPYATEAAWRELQERAFGSTFSEYFESYALPLTFTAYLWGTQTKDGTFLPPTMNVDHWLEGSQVDRAKGAAFLRSLSLDRRQLQAELRKRLRDNGLPHAPTAFIKSPLIDIGNGLVVGTSPWMVREHLRGGLWIKLMRASKSLRDEQAWPRAFGLTFELTCRDIAVEAVEQPGFIGKLELSKAAGTDEVEDVVVRSNGAAALFSAKSRLMEETVARQAISRSRVIDWYNEFLFAGETVKNGQRFRPGALRLLDANVRRILVPPAPQRVFPVLLTYDHLGENGALYAWIDEQSRRLGLLQGPSIRPLTLMTIDEFEALLRLAARGYSVIELLALKVRTEWRSARMTSFLHEYGKGGPLRLPSMEARFQEITDATHLKLFGRKAPPIAFPDE